MFYFVGGIMFKYRKNIKQKEKYLKKYCQRLKKLQKKNIEINKLNKYLLSNIKFIKYKRKYYFPNQLFAFLSEQTKNKNYYIRDNDIIEDLNKYTKIYKQHLSFWEIKNLKIIFYHIMIDALYSIIMCEPDQIINYSVRKYKNVYNIINSINYFQYFDEENILEKVSSTEQLLLTLKEYKNSSISTRIKYREKIIKLSKNKQLSEFQCVKNLVDKKQSLANFLFKRINYAKVSILLVIISFILAIILSLVLYQYLHHDLFSLFIIPFSYYFFYRVLSWLVPNSVILENDDVMIPKTMCVKYVVLNNSDDVLNELSVLENMCLDINNPNIHFTLLVDCTKCDHQIEPFDDEILTAGLDIVNELNNKYHNNLFYFVYRKRSKHGMLWYGDGNKSGAIDQFIDLLFNKINENDDYNFFVGHSHFYEEYKYLIDIKDNIDLLRLVNILEHPYNKPLIHQNKVVRGYASFSEYGRLRLDNVITYYNYIINLEVYRLLLQNRKPSNLIHVNCLKGGVIYRKHEKLSYNKEVILKNNIILFKWSLNKNSFFNTVQKLDLFHCLLEAFLSCLSAIYFLYLYLCKGNILWITYFGVISFIALSIPWYISCKVLLQYIFNRKYRNDNLDIKKEHPWFDFVIIGILLLLDVYLNVSVVAIIIMFVIMFIGLIRRNING